MLKLLFLYSIFAFVIQDISVKNWAMEARGIMVFIWLGFLALQLACEFSSDFPSHNPEEKFNQKLFRIFIC